MFPHTEFFTHFVAYPSPSFLGPYQPTASSNPGPCSLSAQSSLAAPTDPRVIQAPVEPVSAVALTMRSLVPETACEVDLLQCHSRGMLPVLTVFVVGTCSELVHLGVGLYAVAVFVGTVVTVVGVGIAAAVAFGSGEIGDLNRSVMTEGTPAGSFGLL